MSKALQNVIILNGIVDVRAFGAKGDGVTDDTAAFEAAHATGKLVYAPAGDYAVRRIDVASLAFVGLYGPSAKISLLTGTSGGDGYIYNVVDPGDFYLSVKEIYGPITGVDAGGNEIALINIRTTGVGRNTDTIIIENTKFNGSAQRWGHVVITNNGNFGQGAKNICIDNTTHIGYGNRSGIGLRGGHRNVNITGTSFNNDGQVTASAGSPNCAITVSGEVGFESLGNVTITGADYRYGLGFFFGQTFENCTLSGIQIYGDGKTSLGSGVFNSTCIKIDDIGVDSTFNSEDVHISNSSNVSAQYAFACEESTPSTTGSVTLQNWRVDGQVRLIAVARYYDIDSVSFFPRAGGSGPSYDAGMLAAPPACPGIVHNCRFHNLNPAFNDQNGWFIFKNNHFLDSAVAWFGTSAQSVYEGNIFYGTSLSDAFVMDSLNASAPVKLTLNGNRKGPGAGTKNVRMIGSAATMANQIFTFEGNTLDWDATVATNTQATVAYYRNNSGLTDRLAPTATITAASSTALAGNTRIALSGATAVNNFTGAAVNNQITVIIPAGSTVNNGASIVTKSGGNISGPAVRDFALVASVWYEM